MNWNRVRLGTNGKEFFRPFRFSENLERNENVFLIFSILGHNFTRSIQAQTGNLDTIG